MLVYAPLDESRDEPGLHDQIASGQFAILSGRMFEYRDLPEGDAKVSVLLTVITKGAHL